MESKVQSYGLQSYSRPPNASLRRVNISMLRVFPYSVPPYVVRFDSMAGKYSISRIFPRGTLTLIGDSMGVRGFCR